MSHAITWESSQAESSASAKPLSQLHQSKLREIGGSEVRNIARGLRGLCRLLEKFAPILR